MLYRKWIELSRIEFSRIDICNEAPAVASLEPIDKYWASDMSR
jgi:hypothetical protein